MKLGVTLDILNQKDTPAFYADTLANRPAAGFTGRVFISTDTLDLYRDTGTTWVLLSPSSTGTITGAGAVGQVTYFSGTSSITGDNNLFWDSVNGHLGIKTITPDCALDVNHAGTFVAKFNNTTTANTLIGIFNLDNPQWFIGSNSVANDLTFYDATNSPTLVPTTTMKTDGTTYIGGQTTGSGRLNVYSATSDNGIQISGANAPSLRLDNAPTGATKRIGLGIATAANNFIQGSVDRDMCIFNGSTTASPILFGIYGTTNVQEAARISAARNFLVGTNVDGGFRLSVNGTTNLSNTLTIGPLGSAVAGVQLTGNDQSNTRIKITNTGGSSFSMVTGNPSASNNGFAIYDEIGAATRLYISLAGNVLVNSTGDSGEKFQVNGNSLLNSDVTIKSSSSTTFGALTLSNSGSVVNGNGSLISFNINNNNGGLQRAAYIEVFNNFSVGNNYGNIAFNVASATSDATTRVLTLDYLGNATFTGSIAIANAVTAAVAAPSTHKVSILINGVQYYLLASNI